jgi:hypothetical protein
MDLSELQGLLAQLGPNDADKNSARQAAILQFGLGLLGAPKGGEFQRLGMSGMNAAGQYHEALQNAAKERQANLQQAATMQEFMRKAQFAKQLETELGGGAPAVPGAASGGAPGSAPAGPPAMAPAPQGGAPSQPGGLVGQLLSMGVPVSAIRLAAQSSGPCGSAVEARGGIRQAARYVTGAGSLHAGRRNACVCSEHRQRHAYRADNKVEVLPGYAESTGAIAGATARAQEGAKAALDFVDVPDGRGGTVKMPRDMAAKLLGGQQPAQGGNDFQFNLQNQPPNERAAMLRDMQNPSANMPRGNFGQAPSAVDVHGATAAIDTQQGGVRTSNEDFIKNSYRPTQDAMVTARRGNVNLDILDKLPISEKTGWGTSAKVTGARVLEGLGIAPEAAKQYASEGQMFDRVLGENVWALLGQQKGVQSEGDAVRAKKVFANLEGTPQSNQFSRDVARAANNLTIKQGEFYNKNYAKALKTGAPAELENQWMQSAPSLWDDPVMSKWKSYGNDTSANPAANSAKGWKIERVSH